MGNDKEVFTSRQFLVQFRNRIAVRCQIGEVANLGVAGTQELSLTIEKIDIAVATTGSSAGPFITDEGDKAPGLVGVIGGCFDFFPYLFGYLEIIRLMARNIQSAGFAGEGKVVAHAVGANCLAALAVQVSPEWTMRSGRR